MTNTFTLNDIKGAVVEKLEVQGDDYESGAYNNGIDAQSSVKLRFNRAFLIDYLKIIELETEIGEAFSLGFAIGDCVEQVADAIIASGAELLEALE